MQTSAFAGPGSGSIYSPGTFCFIALQRISRFSVKKAIACKSLKNILNRKKRASCTSVLYPVQLSLIIG